MFLSSFAGAGRGAQAVKDLSTGAGLSTGLMFLLVYLWMRPAILYNKAPTPALKEKIRGRVNSVYRDAGLLLLVVSLAQLFLILMLDGDVQRGIIPAVATAFIAKLFILPIAIDWVRARSRGIMGLLYEKETLYTIRPGFSLPLSLKIGMLIFSCALFPFGMAVAALKLGYPALLWTENFINLAGICAITLVVGLSAVFYGIQQPLDGLIRRMKGVASGDYGKTRIYFSDEVAHLKAGFNEMVDGLKEREELQDTFGKYLSIEIARELIKNKKVNLGGEDMEAAVMFCDIRNFTTLSEKLSASKLVDFLNSYFHFITPPITANKGVINKFMGDAVMAIYTPLLGSDDYAADAVRAALGMRKALAEFNASGIAPGRVDFGIGIHAGKLVGGNVGTAFRLEYTFIGDTVNIASRLESRTRDFDTDILVSGPALEQARASLGDALKFESLGSAALKGKAAPMEIYKAL